MIVGAGISAVAAANLLISEGINDIVLLEATDRVGGRIWSIDLGTLAVHLTYGTWVKCGVRCMYKFSLKCAIIRVMRYGKIHYENRRNVEKN